MILIMVTFITLQSFCQTTKDSVWVEDRGDKKVLVMTPEKGIEISNDLIDGDKCIDENFHLRNKIKNYKAIAENDSKLIQSLQEEIIRGNLQLDVKKHQEEILEKRLDLQKSQTKYQKKKNTKKFLKGAGIGIIIGVLLGVGLGG